MSQLLPEWLVVERVERDIARVGSADAHFFDLRWAATPWSRRDVGWSWRRPWWAGGDAFQWEPLAPNPDIHLLRTDETSDDDEWRGLALVVELTTADLAIRAGLARLVVETEEQLPDKVRTIEIWLADPLPAQLAVALSRDGVVILKREGFVVVAVDGNADAMERVLSMLREANVGVHSLRYPGELPGAA